MIALLLSPHTLLLVPILLVGYILGLLVYRLKLHPYAEYPGPLLAKLTYFYGLYHAYKGDVHVNVWKCHEKYGPYVRYAPDRLLINTNHAIKDIYGYGKNVQKSKAYEPLPVFPNAFNTHTAINKTIHGRKRRIVSQGFSDAALRSAEPYILEKVRLLCLGLYWEAGNIPKSLPRAWSEKKNMANWSTYMTVDVVSELAFGKSLDMLTESTNRWITESISSYIRRSYLAMHYPALFRPGSGWLSADTWFLPGLLRDRERYMKATKGIVKNRIEKEDVSRKDIMSYLLSAHDPETGEKLSFAEVWAEAYLMISAGGDTTATAISATFFYLSRNAECLVTLTDEIRSTFTDVESIRQGPQLQSCQYLRACLEEAMRMSPSAPGVFYREILPSGISVYNKDTGKFDHFHEGLDLGTGIYAIHHNLDYFPNPFTYNPSRWLSPATSPEKVALARSAFMPFSSGPRACVAKPLAYLEMTLAVARVVWLGEMRVAGREGEGGWGVWKNREVRKDEYQVEDQMTSWKDGPVLEFRGQEGLDEVVKADEIL